MNKDLKIPVWKEYLKTKDIYCVYCLQSIEVSQWINSPEFKFEGRLFKETGRYWHQECKLYDLAVRNGELKGS